jgi:hypothetical protein
MIKMSDIEIIPDKKKAEPKIKYCRCCGKAKKIICKTCLKKKKPDEFHAGKSICKDCRSKYNKEKYQHKKAKKLITKITIQPENLDPIVIYEAQPDKNISPEI